MTFKQVISLAAITVMAVGMGLYGLSENVEGQESFETIVVPQVADHAETVQVKVTPAGAATTVTQKPSARLKSARQISAALEDEILLEFNETPLSEVVDYLKTARQIPIIIDDSALDDIGLAADVPINCSYSGISLRAALALMLEQLDLDYVIRNEVLMITSADAARMHLDPRFYKVDNLDCDELIELITTMVAPESWDEAGGTGRIAIFGSKGLVIAQTDQIHGQIVDFLEKPREAMNE